MKVLSFLTDSSNDDSKGFLRPSFSIRHADTNVGSYLSFQDITRKLVTQQSHQWGYPTLREAGGLKTFPCSGQRNRALSKNRLPHFTASESLSLKQKRQQVFSTHYPWESPSWHPFNMGSLLPEWRPQPLGAPDTPLPRVFASTLAAANLSAGGGLVRLRNVGLAS